MGSFSINSARTSALTNDCIDKTIVDVKGEGAVKWNQYLLSNKIYTAALKKRSFLKVWTACFQYLRWW
jgi:hypothetical protein